MARESQLADLIGEMYEAAVDPAGLDRLALTVARAFATESGFIALAAPKDGVNLPPVVGLPSATANFDAWARSAYAEHYHDRNIWYERGSKLGTPAIVLSQELADDRTLLRSEWYDYCAKLDAFHCLGAHFHVDANLIGMFGAHRPRRAARFDEADRRRMMRLLPHLQRALQVNVRLTASEGRSALRLDIIDNLGMGVIVTGADGTVLFANEVAERVLSDGKVVTVSKGRVRLADPHSQLRLEKVILEAARSSAGRGNGAGSAMSVSGPSGGWLSLLVSPFRSQRAGFGPEKPAAIVIFSDPARDCAEAVRLLARACRLTPAESRLLSALFAGRTVSEYADAVGITVGTARNHLKNVLGKTGFHRQIDLVRTVASGSLAMVSLDDSPDRYR